MAKTKTRPAICLLLALFLMAAFCTAAYADDDDEDDVPKAQQIDYDAEMSLTVIFEGGGSAVEGASIRICKVADIYIDSYAVCYTPTVGSYDYAEMTASECNDTAAELAAMDGIEDLADVCLYAETDSSGEAEFTGLEPGIYLVTLESEAYTEDGTQYTFDPYLATVPYAEIEDGMYVWTYISASAPKTAVVAVDEAPAVGGTPLWPYVFAAAAATALLAAALKKRKIFTEAQETCA